MKLIYSILQVHILEILNINFAYTSMSSSNVICLSRILFIFPSQYLFTIGFKTLFCFRLEVQPPVVNTYNNSRHKFRALYFIELTYSIRNSLNMKDFSKTIKHDILQKCIEYG